MATCTSCPHNLTDKSGTLLPHLADRAYETMPCATCDLIHGGSVLFDNDKNNHGEIAVSLDALVNEGVGEFDEAVDPASQSDASPDCVEDMVCDLSGEIREWRLSLGWRDRKILRGLENKETFEEIGRKCRLTKQGVHARTKMIRKKFKERFQGITAFAEQEVF